MAPAETIPVTRQPITKQTTENTAACKQPKQQNTLTYPPATLLHSHHEILRYLPMLKIQCIGAIELTRFAYAPLIKLLE